MKLQKAFKIPPMNVSKSIIPFEKYESTHWTPSVQATNLSENSICNSQGRRDICVPDWFEDTYHEVGNKHASETTRLKPSNFTQREE